MVVSKVRLRHTATTLARATVTGTLGSELCWLPLFLDSGPLGLWLLGLWMLCFWCARSARCGRWGDCDAVADCLARLHGQPLPVDV